MLLSNYSKTNRYAIYISSFKSPYKKTFFHTKPCKFKIELCNQVQQNSNHNSWKYNFQEQISPTIYASIFFQSAYQTLLSNYSIFPFTQYYDVSFIYCDIKRYIN